MRKIQFAFFSLIHFSSFEFIFATTLSITQEEQIHVIDFQITKLNERLQSYQLNAEKAEISGQGNMFDKWEVFAKDIEESESNNKAAEFLEIRIHDLTAQKMKILGKDSK
jgi:hypothetical protein